MAFLIAIIPYALKVLRDLENTPKLKHFDICGSKQTNFHSWRRLLYLACTFQSFVPFAYSTQCSRSLSSIKLTLKQPQDISH